MTISINRALTSLKYFRDRWTTARTRPVADVMVGSKSSQTGEARKDIENKIRANHQSALDMVESVYLKRKLINKANQETIIEVAGREFTIADALIYRAHVIPLLKEYIEQSKAQHNRAKQIYAQATGNYDTIMSDKGSEDDETRENYRKMFEPELLSNIDLIEEQENFVNQFLAELNGILSEKNAIVQIDTVE